MPRRTTVFIFLLAFLAVLLGINYVRRPFDQVSPEEVTNTTLSTASPIPVAAPEPLTSTLTPEQKVAQVLALPFRITNTEWSSEAASLSARTQARLAWVKEKQPGFVTLFGSQVSTSSADRAIRSLKNTAKNAENKTVALWVAVDHEGGSVQRLNGVGFTKLPSWRTFCNQDPSLATQSAGLVRTSAQELRRAGVDVVLAPVLDMTAPASPLGNRTCSDQVATVSANASVYVTAFQRANIISVFKHFPGIGSATKDTHQAFDQVTVTAADAQVYRQLLTNFPQSWVMTAHIGVINQYPDIPCSLSTACIDELRKNFSQVLVVSDALEMPSARTADQNTVPEVAVAALRAGNDVLLFGDSLSLENMQAVYDRLLEEYQQNSAFRSRLDAAVLKIQAAKLSKETN